MKRDEPNRQPFFYDTPTIGALLHLERSNGTPLYRQISQRLQEAILSGELPAGTRLPPERTLAQELGVNRTTIMHAYNALSSAGLTEGHVGRGTVVKHGYFRSEDDYNDHATPSWLLGLSTNGDALIGPDIQALSELSSTKEPKQEMISLAQGTPPADMLPTDLIRLTIERSLSKDRESALGYCPVEGLQSLRRNLALRMRRRGVRVDIQNILILSGSTQGLGLIGRFLLTPGDEVVVEVPTYLGAIQTFRALGAHIIGIPTDNEGMRVDMLEAILARRQPRFIYTMPTFQNPSGSLMSPERRHRLLLLANRYQIPIIEDDPYGELYFGEQAPLPLKAQDTNGNVLYLGTCSKILAPGLRVAWLVASETVIERLGLYKQTFDLNTNALGQWTIAEMIRCGMLDEHLMQVRPYYARKLHLMLEAIKMYCPTDIRISPPGGGMHLWCRLSGNIRARNLLREAAHEGVTFACGELFHVDGGGHYSIRLSFASSEDKNITEGIRRLGIAIKHIIAHRSSSLEQDQAGERLPIV